MKKELLFEESSWLSVYDDIVNFPNLFRSRHIQSAPIAKTSYMSAAIQLPNLYQNHTFLPEYHHSKYNSDVVSTFSFVDRQEAISPPVDITLPAASIKGHAWIDENDDGKDDVGEPRMSNLSIQLWQQQEIIATTKTDMAGRYLFDALPPAAYRVTVDHATLPYGLTNQNQLRRAVRMKQAKVVDTVINSGQEYTIPGFSFHYGNPNANDGTGAIGDRVWLDADADGIQDNGEVGLKNVSVMLFGDIDNDGLITNNEWLTTTKTLPDGTYVFTDLSAGIYRLRVDATAGSRLDGYTQTADPDYIGIPAIRPDNQTTQPILLAPGDAYLNVDFGYIAPMSNQAGGTIYLDTDVNQRFDGEDAGISAVTLSLIDHNQNIIATTYTDENGFYLFPAFPDGIYQLLVTDMRNMLAVWVQNDDPDNFLDAQTSFFIQDGQQNRSIDFGYIPFNHMPSSGLVGQAIFFDNNNNGIVDPNEGIDNVVVQLTDLSGNPLQSTTTNENGRYYLGRIDSGSYQIKVIPTSLPIGLLPTIDPDDTADGITNITIDDTNALINVDQNFGYIIDPSNTIGRISGEVWEDENANGLYDDRGNAFEGVTISLYLDLDDDSVIDQNDPLFRTTQTDEKGQFVFANLPADMISYMVTITDRDRKLSGYWHSIGRILGADGNSQSLPYQITLTPTKPENRSAYFGYYIDLAAIGNRIWFDENQNGIQDSNEQDGFANTTVQLTVTYPNNELVIMTESGENGEYAFRNLLADEDYNGTGSEPPTYTLSVTFADQNTPTLIDVGTNDLIDADNYIGVQAKPIQGESDVMLLSNPAAEPPEASYDFGFIRDPNPDVSQSAVQINQITVQPLSLSPHFLTILLIILVATSIIICHTHLTK